MDIEYIERILKMRQELIDDPTIDNKKVKELDEMFKNFMEMNYKIKINVDLSENKWDIMSRIVKINGMQI